MDITKMDIHPLATAIEAARAGGLNYYITVGSTPEMRLRMGFPATVVDDEPLLVALQAEYDEYAQPVASEHGLSCKLSFDALYECRIPWSTITSVVIQNTEVAAWPAAWKGKRDADEPEPPPDNIRIFRPRPQD